MKLSIAKPVLRQSIHRRAGNRSAESGRCAEAYIIPQDEQDFRCALGGRRLLWEILDGVLNGASDMPLKGCSGRGRTSCAAAGSTMTAPSTRLIALRMVFVLVLMIVCGLRMCRYGSQRCDNTLNEFAKPR
jgi:hypothetical protein